MRIMRRKVHRFEVDGAMFECDVALGSVAAQDILRSAIRPNGHYHVTAILEGFLTGWSGVQGENGEDLAFNHELVSRLPEDIAAELVGQIATRSREEAERTEAVLGESEIGAGSTGAESSGAG